MDDGTNKERLLELYEARGDPDTFAQAKRLYEQALAGPRASDPTCALGTGTCWSAMAATRCGRPWPTTSARSSWT